MVTLLAARPKIMRLSPPFRVKVYWHIHFNLESGDGKCIPFSDEGAALETFDELLKLMKDDAPFESDREWGDCPE